MNYTYTIHTDGSCLKNPDGPGGWAFLRKRSDGAVLEKASGLASTTNNRMELMAAIMALRSVPEQSEVALYTDSAYLKNGITSWIRGWKRRGWKKADGSPVLNQPLWQELDALYTRRQVSFHWVKGHAGNAENERCDTLARTAAEKAGQGLPSSFEKHSGDTPTEEKPASLSLFPESGGSPSESAAPELQEQLLSIFTDLHEHPELSFEEKETTQQLKNVLIAAGIRLAPFPLSTGLLAVIGKGDPAICLRADIDALPVEEKTGLSYASRSSGRMHACGHDFHMTAVLGAALLLKQHEDDLPGTVKILFQPGEESAKGARSVLDAHVLDDVQAIFGFHVSPALDAGVIGLKEGALTAAVDRFTFTFRGKSAHGAHPEDGIDPVPMLASFVLAVQTIVSRTLPPKSSALVSLTHIASGSTWNIIPAEAMTEGTVRCFSPKERACIRDRMTAIARGTATAFGGTVDIDWYAGPPATRNDAGWTGLARSLALKQGLSIASCQEDMIGEDFAFYQEKIPGAFLLVGTGKGPGLHDPKFQADPGVLAQTAQYFAALATEALKKLS